MEPRISTILPLTKGKSIQPLSYFTTQDITPGDIVIAPYKSKTIEGIVIQSKPAHTLKHAVKDLVFSLKKIEAKSAHAILPPSFFAIAEELAVLYNTSLARIVRELYLHELVHAHCPATPFVSHTTQRTQEGILQASFEERIVWHKTHARTLFAQKKSYVIIAPSATHATHIHHQLSQQLHSDVHLLTQKTKHKHTTITALRESAHPILLITTPLFLPYLPLHTATITLEYEASPNYIQRGSSTIDRTYMVAEWCRVHDIEFVRADTLVQYATYQAFQDGILEPVRPVALHLAERESPYCISMQKERANDGVLADETIKALKKITSEQQAIIFCARATLATSVVCNDCHTPVTHQGVGVRLRQDATTGERFFWTQQHGRLSSAKQVCTHCGSWHLVALGITTDRVREVLERELPEHTLFVADRLTIRTPEALKKLLTAFYKSKRGVLITTEFTLPYLTTPVQQTVVASFDALLHSTHYRSYEKTLRIFFALSALSQSATILQTRQPDHDILHHLKENGFMQLLHRDLVVRKTYQYPPFCTRCSLTITATLPQITHALTTFQATHTGVRLEWKAHHTATFCIIYLDTYNGTSLPSKLPLVRALLTTLAPFQDSLSIDFDGDMLG